MSDRPDEPTNDDASERAKEAINNASADSPDSPAEVNPDSLGENAADATSDAATDAASDAGAAFTPDANLDANVEAGADAVAGAVPGADGEFNGEAGTAEGAAGAATAAGTATKKPGGGTAGKLIGIVLGLTAAVALMLFAFLTPQYNSGPSDLPLAVAGDEELTGQLTQMLDQQQPGAFEYKTYDDGDSARNAVADRDAIGGIEITQEGATVYGASGAGQSYIQMLNSIASGLQTQGLPVQADDVAQTTDEDPNATGLTSLALPLAFGGMISAAVLSLVLKKRYGARIIGSLGFSVLAGLAIGAILQFGFGTFDANYWAVSGVLALGIAGTSTFVMGLEALLGYAGLGIGAVLTILISNPLSGIATGWQWLPEPWGAIGQFLPIGAAGDATRSVAFFDGAGIAKPVLVLAAWTVVGILLVGAGAARNRAKTKKAVASQDAVPENAASEVGADGAEGTDGATDNTDVLVGGGDGAAAQGTTGNETSTPDDPSTR